MRCHARLVRFLANTRNGFVYLADASAGAPGLHLRKTGRREHAKG
jgi:hypothetical protein